MRSFNYRAPLKKQSKKAQKEYNNSRRNYWNTNPVTKVVPSKKHEKLEKAVANDDD